MMNLKDKKRIDMFGLKKLQSDVESLKVQNYKKNDEIAHLKNERESLRKEIDAFIEVLGKETAKISDKVSLLDLNLDAERAERKQDRKDHVRCSNQHEERLNHYETMLKDHKEAIKDLCQGLTECLYDIDQLKKSLIKPKKKVGRPRKIKVEPLPKEVMENFEEKEKNRKVTRKQWIKENAPNKS